MSRDNYRMMEKYFHISNNHIQ